MKRPTPARAPRTSPVYSAQSLATCRLADIAHLLTNLQADRDAALQALWTLELRLRSIAGPLTPGTREQLAIAIREAQEALRAGGVPVDNSAGSVSVQLSERAKEVKPR